MWEPRDLDVLARAVADLALGQWKHVENLLAADTPWLPANASYAIESAIKSLTVPPGHDPWHRDGWVFQLISWIAAVEARNGLVRVPQMDQASKGFDGLQLLTNRGRTRVKGAVVFEDKATDSPRQTIRTEVWPSFAAMEAGDRDSALAAEIASLLDRLPHVDSILAVDRIMRDPGSRMYRVSITAGAYHARRNKLGNLFKGFEETVTGDRARRYANILELDDLRPWMSALCARAVDLLERQR